MGASGEERMQKNVLWDWWIQVQRARTVVVTLLLNLLDWRNGGRGENANAGEGNEFELHV